MYLYRHILFVSELLEFCMKFFYTNEIGRTRILGAGNYHVLLNSIYLYNDLSLATSNISQIETIFIFKSQNIQI